MYTNPIQEAIKGFTEPYGKCIANFGEEINSRIHQLGSAISNIGRKYSPGNELYPLHKEQRYHVTRMYSLDDTDSTTNLYPLESKEDSNEVLKDLKATFHEFSNIIEKYNWTVEMDNASYHTTKNKIISSNIVFGCKDPYENGYYDIIIAIPINKYNAIVNRLRLNNSPINYIRVFAGGIKDIPIVNQRMKDITFRHFQSDQNTVRCGKNYFFIRSLWSIPERVIKASKDGTLTSMIEKDNVLTSEVTNLYEEKTPTVTKPTRMAVADTKYSLKYLDDFSTEDLPKMFQKLNVIH